MVSRLVAASLPVLPRSVVAAVAKRYIAGDGIEDARRVVEGLLEEGFVATVDVLGEDVTTPDEADRALESYRALVLSIPSWKGAEGRVSVSLKPTQFGLRFEPAATRERVLDLAKLAAYRGIFLRLDMEDSGTTDGILALDRELVSALPGRTGTVLQSMLRRSEADAEALVRRGGANLRLCKGIYREPKEIAFQRRGEVRDAFVRLARILLAGGAKCRLATHDLVLVDRLLDLGRELGIPPQELEFQALLGVPMARTHAALRRAGHPVRLYVPYGDAWYAYSLRRLRENPAIAGHVVKALVLPSRA